MVEMFCLMQDRCKDELTMSVVSSFFSFRCCSYYGALSGHNCVSEMLKSSTGDL